MALFEGAKGALIFLAGFGLLALVHRDLQYVADEVVRRFHLNPARHYPRLFIGAAGKAADARLWLPAGAALLYACFGSSKPTACGGSDVGQGGSPQPRVPSMFLWRSLRCFEV